MAEITYTFRGMNNVLDPSNVGVPDPKRRDLYFTEVLDLVNVDPSNSDSLSLRPGRIAIHAGAGCHSGWSNPLDPFEAYFVQTGNLWRITADTPPMVNSDVPPIITPILSLVRRGLLDLPMHFVQVNDVVRYSNGVQCGVIEGGVDTPPFQPTDQFKAPMVAGKFEEFYNGRLYALVDNYGGTPGCALICSDALDTPGGVESMDTRYNVVAVYDGPANGICRVDEGLYVSAGAETFYHDGDDAVAGLTPTYKGEGFRQKSVAPYAMIPGTVRHIESELVGVDGVSGWACIWASTRGICLGANGGHFTNLTLGKISYPPAVLGAAMVREQFGIAHFVVALQAPAGQAYNSFLPRDVDVQLTEVL